MAFRGWLAVGRLASGLSVGRGFLWELFLLLRELLGAFLGLPGGLLGPSGASGVNLGGSGGVQSSQVPRLRIKTSLLEHITGLS